MKRWVLPTVGLAQSKLAAPAKRAKPGYKITVFKRYSFFGCRLRLTSKRVFIRPLLAESGLSSMAQPISFLRLEQAPPSRSPSACSSLYCSVASLISSPHHASATCARMRISPAPALIINVIILRKLGARERFFLRPILCLCSPVRIGR
jgi:hypothetical protein